MRYEKKLDAAEQNVCTGKGAHSNPDDARFCDICGNKTAYFQMGLLRPHDVILHEHENAREGMTVKEFDGLV